MVDQWLVFLVNKSEASSFELTWCGLSFFQPVICFKLDSWYLLLTTSLVLIIIKVIYSTANLILPSGPPLLC